MVSGIIPHKGPTMKPMQRNRATVSIHGVLAWNCDLLRGPLSDGTDMFAVEALELLPFAAAGQILPPPCRPVVSDRK